MQTKPLATKPKLIRKNQANETKTIILNVYSLKFYMFLIRNLLFVLFAC